MLNKIKHFAKKSWWAFALFILGFFLIKRGIDSKVAQDLAIEKAREDAIKLELIQREQEEKEEIRKQYEEEQRLLAEEQKRKQLELEEEAKKKKKILRHEAKEKPDEFGKKFGKKFNLNYDKDKK